MRKKRVFVELVQSHRTYMELHGHIRSCPRAKWQPAHSNTVARAVRDQSTDILIVFVFLLFLSNKNAEHLLVVSVNLISFGFGMTQTEEHCLMLLLARVEFFFYIVSENSYNFTIFRQFTDETVDQKWSSHKSLLEKNLRKAAIVAKCK